MTKMAARARFLSRFTILTAFLLTGCLAQLSRLECENIFNADAPATAACVEAFDPDSVVEPAQCEILYPDFDSPGVKEWLPLARELGVGRFVGYLNENYAENLRVGCEIGAILKVKFHSKRKKRHEEENSFTGGGVTIGHPVPVNPPVPVDEQ